MKRSTDRILTTHAGSLPRPDDLRTMLTAKANGDAYDRDAFTTRVRGAVSEVAQKQAACGIDVINDGELAKSNFSNYARERLSGFEERDADVGQGYTVGSISGRDVQEFPGYFQAHPMFGGVSLGRRVLTCVGPLKYIGQAEVQRDIANFKAALQGVHAEETFLPAVAPGTIEHWLRNGYYPTDEAYVYAIADAMHEEYKAIADAGFLLQIDDPDLADAWQMHNTMDVAEYRKFAELRIDALNHALRDIPTESIRFHMCWGSYHGPHKYDIPLKDIVDII